MNKLYGRLARTNLKNNKPLYIPYILAGVMTVALFYLMVFLNNNPGLDQMRAAIISRRSWEWAFISSPFFH